MNIQVIFIIEVIFVTYNPGSEYTVDIHCFAFIISIHTNRLKIKDLK